jgi:hypothetical protein
MYDYVLANDIAKQRHEEMIADATRMAQIRQQRRLHQPANRNLNHLLVAITHLFTR